jgi:hypothetical protein
MPSSPTSSTATRRKMSPKDNDVDSGAGLHWRALEGFTLPRRSTSFFVAA